MKKNKKIISIILILLFGIGLILSIYLYIIGFKIENLVNYISNNLLIISLIGIALFSIRIFLFIPSTLIIIGLGIISNNFILTLIISIVGILIGLLQTYYIGYLLEEDLEGTKIIKKIKPHLSKIRKNGFTYIFIGCLAPIFPTDIICYSAGFIKYKLSKFLLAGIMGEIPLIILYSYLGGNADLFIKNISYIFIIIGFIFIFYFIIKKYLKKKRNENRL